MEDAVRDYGTDFCYDTVLACLAFRWFPKSRFDQSVGDSFGGILVVAFFVIVDDVTKQLRTSDVLDRLMKASELVCSSLPDVRNGQRKKPPGKWQGPGAFDCFDRFGR